LKSNNNWKRVGSLRTRRHLLPLSDPLLPRLTCPDSLPPPLPLPLPQIFPSSSFPATLNAHEQETVLVKNPTSAKNTTQRRRHPPEAPSSPPPASPALLLASAAAAVSTPCH
jgi:hypothetical protein